MTPLEKLGSAIETFLRDTESIEPHAFMTGWVMVASTARVQADDNGMLPMVTGAQYAIGPETSVVQAHGLAKYLDIVCERAQWSALNESEDDD